jgi:ferritin-like metal-binding protein YciE
MKLTNLQDLYVEELKDLYDAEKRLVQALPKMAKEVSSEELAKAINDHLDQTREHVTRLEQIFEELGKNPARKKCEGLVGILEEGKEILEQDGDSRVKDAAIIAAAQRAEHYEIAVYGTLRTWSEILGYDEAAKILEQTLEEEKEADKLLTEIASNINPEAAEEEEGEEEEEEVEMSRSNGPKRGASSKPRMR